MCNQPKYMLKGCFHSHHRDTDSALGRSLQKKSSSEEAEKLETFPIVLFHGICRTGPRGTFLFDEMPTDGFCYKTCLKRIGIADLAHVHCKLAPSFFISLDWPVILHTMVQAHIVIHSPPLSKSALLKNI